MEDQFFAVGKSTGDTQENWERETCCRGGKGRGKAKSYDARRESLGLLYTEIQQILSGCPKVLVQVSLVKQMVYLEL